MTLRHETYFGDTAFVTRPEIRGSFGMVSSTHWLASAVAMAILERGGNAADAAIAGGLVLQVAEPHLNGPGGEVPILVRDDAGAVSVYCGQGVSPGSFTLDAVSDRGMRSLPATGLVPLVVPGAFGAWMELGATRGSLSLREVVEPAIHYARDGIPVTADIEASLESVADRFTKDWPTSAEVWLPTGQVPPIASRLCNPLLANTYSRIVEEAEARAAGRQQQYEAAIDVWYRGFIADAIDAYLSQAAVLDDSGHRNQAFLTGQDLASWNPSIEESASYEYHGFEVHKPGPWSQGPVFLQQLALLRRLNLGDCEPGSADWVHLIVEASKLAFADREAWYGDAQEVPLGDLLSEQYNEGRRRLIGDAASLSLRPGSPNGSAPVMPTYSVGSNSRNLQPGVGEPTFTKHPGDGDTCHIDVADRFGRVVSATPSGGWFQASPAIPGLGFCLSTRGQMFWQQEGLPNSVAPRIRPRTTLSPTLAVRDDGSVLAFGTPGGDAQDQWTLQVFLSIVHHALPWQQALDQPAFHSTHFPESFYPRQAFPGELVIEESFAKRTRSDLVNRGHLLREVPPWSEGRVTIAGRDGEWLRAAANARGAQCHATGR